MTDSVSIVIPAYNAEKTIIRCLDSIVNQTYKNLEILVINDGSKDKTQELVESYKDERIILINKENGGVSSARNKGIEVATGEYITFIDSDDYVAHDYIETLLIPCQNGADISCSNYLMVDENGVPLNNRKNDFSEDFEITAQEIADDYFKWLDLGIVNFSARFFRRSVLGESRYSTELKWGEDGSFNIENFKKMNKMHLSAEKRYFYVIHSGQTTAKKMKNYTDMMLIHMGDINRFIEMYRGYDKEPTRKGMGKTWIAVFLEAAHHSFSLKEYREDFRKLKSQPWAKFMKEAEGLSFRLRIIDLFVKLNTPELIYLLVKIYSKIH